VAAVVLARQMLRGGASRAPHVIAERARAHRGLATRQPWLIDSMYSVLVEASGDVICVEGAPPG